MAYTLATRHNDGVSVLHDRNPLFVRLSDGSLRNAYTLRIHQQEPRAKDVRAVGGRPAGRRHRRDRKLELCRMPIRSIEVGPDQTREVRVLVTARDPIAPGASIPIVFRIVPKTGGSRGERRRPFLRTMRP